jgi:hypothetical protein
VHTAPLRKTVISFQLSVFSKGSLNTVFSYQFSV